LSVRGAGDAPVEVVSDRERFSSKIRDYQHEPELFIDIETADWWTPAPRVALLQVWAGREVSVFDVLAPGMGEVLSDCFVPQVMANQRIRKWAHSASYERRFLGGAHVQNLECTLHLARSIAFHRLPIETLSLASLVLERSCSRASGASTRRTARLRLIIENP
jgi:ribonuclease D